MRIAEGFGRTRPVVSFEFFPPKTEAGFRSLYRTIGELKRLDPGFVSVTWGAGGSTRRQTVELVTRIQQEIGITAMAHLTCVGSTPEEIGEILDRLAAAGIENLLALGGDPPRDQPDYQPTPGAFRFASELVAFAHTRWNFRGAFPCHPALLRQRGLLRLRRTGAQRRDFRSDRAGHHARREPTEHRANYRALGCAHPA